MKASAFAGVFFVHVGQVLACSILGLFFLDLIFLIIRFFHIGNRVITALDN